MKTLTKALGYTVVVLALAYLLATLPFGSPREWDSVRSGMTRDEANRLLNVHPWQAANEAYLVFRKAGLRTWYIDVAFTEDDVASVRVFHEDLHDEVLGDVRRVWAYRLAAKRSDD